MCVDSKKNICFVNSCKTWGGGEKWFFEIISQLYPKYNVCSITNTNSELYFKLKSTFDFKIFPVNISNLSFLNPLKLFKIYRILKSKNIDTIILGLPSDVKTVGFIAKYLGVKKIIYRRGTALPIKNSLLNRYIFHNLLTDVIVNSLEIKSKILEKNKNIFSENKIHLIYNGVKIIDSKNHFVNTQAKNLIVGNVGRLVDQKGQIYLVKLAKQLKIKGLDIKIKIAGKGKLKKYLLEEVKKYDVADYIDFLDFIDEMDQFYQNIDIYIQTSIHEGSANAVLEAMSHGKPVIAYKISSMPELINDSKNGYLVEFGDIEKLVEKIELLYANSELILELGQTSKKIAEEKFNLFNCVKQVESII